MGGDKVNPPAWFSTTEKVDDIRRRGTSQLPTCFFTSQGGVFFTTQGGGAERWLVRSRDKCDIVAAADYGTDMFKTR